MEKRKRLKDGGVASDLHKIDWVLEFFGELYRLEWHGGQPEICKRSNHDDDGGSFDSRLGIYLTMLVFEI